MALTPDDIDLPSPSAAPPAKPRRKRSPLEVKRNPDAPPDDGTIGLPKIAEGNNKLPPPDDKGGGKGSEDDDQNRQLGLTDDEKQKLLTRVRKRFKRCMDAEDDNRKKAVEDLKFYDGDQWPADVKAQRAAEGRPCHTINKMKTFVHQVVNDLRQTRPSINVSPVGERGDKEVAKMFRGLLRAIERDSAADIAYDTAIFNAVANGWGYVRVDTDYVEPNDFDQTFRIRRIRNPFTVYTDPDAQEPEGADAKYVFITELMPRDEFRDLYPDADPMNWTDAAAGDTTMKNWTDPENVRVAEYWEVKTERRVLVALDNGHTGWEDQLGPEAKERIAAKTLTVLNRRRAECRSIEYHKVSAKNVLESLETKWHWIPVVRFIGNEVDIEGKSKLSGIVRDAKDPQRQLNYWETKFTETVALAPLAPYIMTEGQVEGHEDRWAQANTKPFPYLLYKPDSLSGKPAPPPARQAPPPMPQGVQQAIVNQSQNMQATTGIRFDATMNERMKDESGKAIRELRRSGDLGSYHYADNAARALRQIGRLIVDAIPKVMDTKRIVTLLREDDGEELAQIDPTAPKPYQETRRPDTQKVLKIFNPTIGKYGVTVTIGPSYATKRIEAAESMMEFGRLLGPQQFPMIADLVAGKMDWDGAEQLAARLAKALPPNMLTPEQKDVPPQIQALIQKLQDELKQAGQQIQQLNGALTEKKSDRALVKEKIARDYEAKVLAILQKAQASEADPVGQVKSMAEAVKAIMELMTPPEQPNEEE